MNACQPNQKQVVFSYQSDSLILNGQNELTQCSQPSRSIAQYVLNTRRRELGDPGKNKPQVYNGRRRLYTSGIGRQQSVPCSNVSLWGSRFTFWAMYGTDIDAISAIEAVVIIVKVHVAM